MKSLPAHFNRIKEKNAGLGDYVILMRAVNGRKFSERVIKRWFNELVPKDDYASGDKKYLINELVKISNTPLRKVNSDPNSGLAERKPINMKITLYERKTTN